MSSVQYSINFSKIRINRGTHEQEHLLQQFCPTKNTLTACLNKPTSSDGNENSVQMAKVTWNFTFYSMP